jgi:hypothetical protein
VHSEQIEAEWIEKGKTETGEKVSRYPALASIIEGFQVIQPSVKGKSAELLGVDPLPQDR